MLENPAHLTGAVKFIFHPIRALPGPGAPWWLPGGHESSLLGLSGQILADGAHPTSQPGALGTSLGLGTGQNMNLWVEARQLGTGDGPAVVLGQEAYGHGKLT